jgi:hypothetical protein
MSDTITNKGSAQALHARMPALNGDEVQEAAELQRDLVKAALHRSRTSAWEVLFPSELTREVRKAEQGIVVQSYRTKAEALRCLDEAGLTMLRAALDHVVAYGCAAAVADTSSLLLAKRVSLEEDLTAEWRRFCEAALEERAWAETMDPATRDATLKKIENSLNGLYRMMEASLRKFEAIVHQTVGKP